MKPQPLPLPFRLFNGETLDSYSSRLASANFSDVESIESGLRERGWLPARRFGYYGYAVDLHAREQVWRRLGAFDPRAFTTSIRIEGQWVTTRVLCLQCAQGQTATGRLPLVGQVCLRHKRWLGPRQFRVGSFPAALTAERHFRSRLASRGMYFDSAPMQIGANCAAVGVSRQLIAERRRVTGLQDISVLTYPEQVAFARLVCERDFVKAIFDPRRDPRRKKAIIERSVSFILPAGDDADARRVKTMIWNVCKQIDDLVAENSWEGMVFAAGALARFESFFPPVRHTDERNER